MKETSQKFCNLYWSVLLGTVLTVGAGLLTTRKDLHLVQTIYGEQADAILSGNLSLVHHPFASSGVPTSSQLGWDLVWAQSGVQQPWGLGVPILLVPFNLVAQLLGIEEFPEALFLLILVSLVSYFALDTGRVASRLLSSSHREVAFFLSAFAIGFLVLFSPAFIAICRSRFLVYEAATAYSLLITSAMLIGLYRYCFRPTTVVYYCLFGLAGVAGFFRPTILAYSMSTIGCLTFLTWRNAWPLRKLCVGYGLFGLGVILLLCSNFYRFGSALEFGHSLNLNNIHAMRYASRFGHPYVNEPVFPAAQELCSLMFLSRHDFNYYDWYKESFFWGQSSTLRWREIYFSGFDVSFLGLLVGGWLIAVICVGRVLVNGRGVRIFVPGSKNEGGYDSFWLFGLWSFVSFTTLFGFYLRFPFMSSRYLCDFAPAFSASGLVLFFSAFFRQHTPRRNRGLIRLVVVGLLLWWVYEVSSQKFVAAPSLRSALEISGSETSLFPEAVQPRKKIGSAYHKGEDLADYGIPFNGAGWSVYTGATKAAATLFVKDPEYLELVVAAVDDPTMPDSVDYGVIQAKVGLEFLELESMEPWQEGMRLRFAGPTRKVYQTGIQTAFVGFVAPEDLDNGDSRFELISVKWKGLE